MSANCRELWDVLDVQVYPKNPDPQMDRVLRVRPLLRRVRPVLRWAPTIPRVAACYITSYI